MLTHGKAALRPLPTTSSEQQRRHSWRWTATHAGGSAFLAKSRLVRFLHERKGFDVLAWEAGFFDVERMEQALRDPAVPLAAASDLGLWSMWAESAEVQTALAFVRSTHATARPLLLAGLDPQLTRARPDELFETMRERLDHVVRLGGERLEALRRAFERFPKGRTFRALTAHERDADRLLFRGLLDELATGRSAEAVWLRREILNVLALYDWHEAVGADRGAPPSFNERPDLNNVRDRAMAENLLFLLNERFPTKKVIVWAASFHILREAEAIDHAPFGGLVPMGQRIAGALGKASYAIAITARTGTTGVPGAAPGLIAPAPAGSLEARVHELGHPVVTVGLRSLAAHQGERFIAQPLGYQPMMGSWQRCFDELLTIDEMRPSTAAAR